MERVSGICGPPPSALKVVLRRLLSMFGRLEQSLCLTGGSDQEGGLQDPTEGGGQEASVKWQGGLS